MAQSINSTHPVRISMTLTTDQHEALKRAAARDGISVRELVRQIMDDHMRQERARLRINPQLARGLEQVAEATGRSEGDLIAGYILAGTTHQLMKLGILPTVPQED